MSTKIMPISDLRRKTSNVLNTIKETGDAVYITQHGRPVAVLVDYERYEQLLAQLEDLADLASLEAAADEPARPYSVAEPPNDYTTRLAGLHQEVWEDLDTDAYLQEERDAWNVSSSD